METKRCNKCSIVQPLDNYYISTNKKTGKSWRFGYCKACHYLMTKPNRKKWGIKNPNKLKKANSKAMRDWRDRMVAGVYLLYTTKGTYVGHSESIKWRVMLHQFGNTSGNVASKGAKVLDYIVLEEIDDREKRKQREKYYIKKLRPDLNIQHNY